MQNDTLWMGSTKVKAASSKANKSITPTVFIITKIHVWLPCTSTQLPLGPSATTVIQSKLLCTPIKTLSLWIHAEPVSPCLHSAGIRCGWVAWHSAFSTAEDVCFVIPVTLLRIRGQWHRNPVNPQGQHLPTELGLNLKKQQRFSLSRDDTNPTNYLHIYPTLYTSITWTGVIVKVTDNYIINFKWVLCVVLFLIMSEGGKKVMIWGGNHFQPDRHRSNKHLSCELTSNYR